MNIRKVSYDDVMRSPETYLVFAADDYDDLCDAIEVQEADLLENRNAQALDTGHEDPACEFLVEVCDDCGDHVLVLNHVYHNYDVEMLFAGSDHLENLCKTAKIPYVVFERVEAK
jgi:hypothetical protein